MKGVQVGRVCRSGENKRDLFVAYMDITKYVKKFLDNVEESLLLLEIREDNNSENSSQWLVDWKNRLEKWVRRKPYSLSTDDGNVYIRFADGRKIVADSKGFGSIIKASDFTADISKMIKVGKKYLKVPS